MRFLDFEFSLSYSLRKTHLQRLASEFRVPLFEGYTMPSSTVCSESAALHKQLLLRPIAVTPSDEPLDMQLISAFDVFCASADGATAFNRRWLQWSQQQEVDAALARHRFLSRYEVPSVWETAEVQESLFGLYAAARQRAADRDETECDMTADADEPITLPLDPDYCHDRKKQRASVLQYTALIGADVAANLEGISRARMEKTEAVSDGCSGAPNIY